MTNILILHVFAERMQCGKALVSSRYGASSALDPVKELQDIFAIYMVKSKPFGRSSFLFLHEVEEGRKGCSIGAHCIGAYSSFCREIVGEKACNVFGKIILHFHGLIFQVKEKHKRTLPRFEC